MLETELTIPAEISLYYDLFVPDNAASDASLVIAVHGYGAHKRYMMREAQLVIPENTVIASIEAPHPHFRKTEKGYRVGYAWLTDVRSEESIALHHQFILRLIDTLADQKKIDRNKIFLYGFSQACALNFRFAFTYPNIAAGLIGVCGGIPGDLEINPAYKTTPADTFYLYGNDDEFYTQEQFTKFDKTLKERLPNYNSRQYEAKHEITEEMRSDIRDFLAARA